MTTVLGKISNFVYFLDLLMYTQYMPIDCFCTYMDNYMFERVLNTEGAWGTPGYHPALQNFTV